MIPATWTDEELLEAFAGCDAVIAHDRSTEPVAVPEPLDDLAPPGRQGWIERLGAVPVPGRAIPRPTCSAAPIERCTSASIAVDGGSLPR